MTPILPSNPPFGDRVQVPNLFDLANSSVSASHREASPSSTALPPGVLQSDHVVTRSHSWCLAHVRGNSKQHICCGNRSTTALGQSKKRARNARTTTDLSQSTPTWTQLLSKTTLLTDAVKTSHKALAENPFVQRGTKPQTALAAADRESAAAESPNPQAKLARKLTLVLQGHPLQAKYLRQRHRHTQKL